jgi:serine/threonine-protein kinase HipA
MTLAGLAGLNIPKIKLENMPTGKALLVERFDLSPNGGRFHLISMRTLCRESPTLYILIYREVAGKIRQHSGSADDAPLFFRKMCFNAVIGNVDDHLKNFDMLHDGKSYRLTPAFDLVPDVTGRIQHTLAFEYHYTTNGRELVDIGKAWDVYNPKNIVTEVCTAAAQIAAIASAAGVLDVGIIRAIKMRVAEFLLEIQ